MTEKEAGRKKKSGYFNFLGETFSKTKIDKRYWKTFLINVVYSAIVLGLFIFLFRQAFSSLQNSMNIQQLEESLSLAGLESSQEILLQKEADYLLNSIVPSVIPYVLIFFVLLFFISAGFKGWIWKTVFNKKTSFKFYFKYLGFVFLAGLAVLAAFFISGLVLNWFSIVLFAASFLLLHLLFVSFVYFVQDGKIWTNLRKGFKKGIKIHLFLLPYLFFIGLLLVRTMINSFLRSFLMKAELSSLTLSEVLQNFWPILQSALPYLIVSSVIGLLFVSYIRIWYAEFISRI